MANAVIYYELSEHDLPCRITANSLCLKWFAKPLYSHIEIDQLEQNDEEADLIGASHLLK